jgi:hypothetical protein
MRTVDEIINPRTAFLYKKEVLKSLFSGDEFHRKVEQEVEAYEAQPRAPLSSEESDAMIDEMVIRRQRCNAAESKAEKMTRTSESWKEANRQLLLENIQLKELLYEARNQVEPKPTPTRP